MTEKEFKKRFPNEYREIIYTYGKYVDLEKEPKINLTAKQFLTFVIFIVVFMAAWMYLTINFSIYLLLIIGIPTFIASALAMGGNVN